MNYTENYQLPQWVETDRVLMEDFNDAMEKVDQGVSALRQYLVPQLMQEARLAADADSFHIPLETIEWERWREVRVDLILSTTQSTSAYFDLDASLTYRVGTTATGPSAEKKEGYCSILFLPIGNSQRRVCTILLGSDPVFRAFNKTFSDLSLIATFAFDGNIQAGSSFQIWGIPMEKA